MSSFLLRACDKTNAKKRLGFTLIETSIVIIIIGLVIGGILVGRSLIRSTQINSAVADIQMYQAAAQAFKQKYGALPGDFASATANWGANSSCAGNVVTAVGTGTQTCNGDGNGKIDIDTSEPFMAWLHLANEGMIQGAFSGISGALGNNDTVVGTNRNVPLSRVEGAAYSLIWVGYISSSSAALPYFVGNYKHMIYFGGRYASGTGAPPFMPVLTISEAQSVDTKFDDGAPDTGNVVSYMPTTNTYTPNCTTGSGPYTYNTSSATYRSGSRCALLFAVGF